MGFRVVNTPGHQCTLPSPADFTTGTIIQCTDIILKGGEAKACHKMWEKLPPGIWEELDHGW
jgi:hypothetical protein